MGASAGILLGAGQLGGAFAEAGAYAAKGKYEKTLADINARAADQQFIDVVKKGEEDANTYSKKVKGMVGSQRAALAAQGIDISSGSAADIQEETMQMGAEDVLKIKNNAYREAFGYKTQASNLRAQGQFDESSAKFNANQTLLAGGMKAAGSFAEAYGSYNKNKPSVKQYSVKNQNARTPRLVND